MRDANGYFRTTSGGVNTDAAPDNDGPEMELFINNTNFVPGGLTDRNPVFLAYSLQSFESATNL
jgi:hypothetical protein